MSKSLKTRRSLQPITRGSTDNKLTQKAMLLNYQFEHGINFPERIINITGPICEDVFKLVDAALTELESINKKDITIKINSPGGCSYQAMAIVGRMTESKSKIITKGYGSIMSAATIILAAGTRRREISQYAQFMWHESMYEIDGKHSQIMSVAAQADREEKFWGKAMSKFTKKTAKFWREQGVGVDAYFTPEQLLKFGVVDGIF